MGQRRIFSFFPRYRIQSFLQACILTYSAGMGHITLLAWYVFAGKSLQGGSNNATSFNSLVKLISDKLLSALYSTILSNNLALNLIKAP